LRSSVGEGKLGGASMATEASFRKACEGPLPRITTLSAIYSVVQ
jgi:hypothetical protein